MGSRTCAGLLLLGVAACAAPAGPLGPGAVLTMEYERPDGALVVDCARELAFNRRGDLLAALTEDYIIVWDVRSGRRLQVIPLKEPWSKRASYLRKSSQFTAYGDLLIVHGESGVLLLDARSGEVEAEFRQPSGVVSQVHCLPDNRVVAVVRTSDSRGKAVQQRVEVWDVPTRTLTHQWDAPLLLTDARINPSGAVVASLSTAGVRVWRLRDDQLVGSWEYKSYSGGVITLSPDGAWVLVGVDRRETFELRETLTGAIRWSIPSKREDFLQFLPDGSALLFRFTDALEFVDAKSGTVTNTIFTHSDAPAMRVRRERYARGGTGTHYERGPDASQRIQAVAVHPAARMIATAGTDWTVRLWEWPKREGAKGDER